MVATAGSTWKLAPSLVAFIDECDRRWPNRPTKSDGSIGDAGHAARASDHNPDDDDADRDPTRWVCAVDLTDASPAQPQPWHILDGIRARRDHRCKYGISEGLAFYSYDKPGRPAWTWVKYDGPNGHFSHGHLSIHNTAKARNDISSWLTGAPVAPTQEDDMPLTIEEIGAIAASSANAVMDRLNAEGTAFGLEGFGNTIKHGIELGRLNANSLAVLLSRDGKITAADIAAAIPDGLAQAVADELAERLKD